MMRLGHKVGVEPLDDQRYARIEDRVLASLGDVAAQRSARSWRRPSRGAWPWAPAVAVAGLALVLLMVLRGSSPEAVWPAPAQMSTHADGRTTLDLGDAVCTAERGTAFTFERGAGEDAGARRIGLDLAAGDVECEVEPRADRAAVVVRAGDVSVTVVGTVFRVVRDDMVHVEVTRGKVQVAIAGDTRVIGVGERWSGPARVVAGESIAERISVTRIDRAAAGRAPEDADAAGGNPGDADRDISGGDISGGDEVTMDVTAPGVDSLHERTGRVPRTGEPAGGQSRPRRTGKSRAGKDAPREPTRSAGNSGKPVARRGGLAATMPVDADRPAAAVDEYGVLSREHGPTAEYALYSMAHVQYFDLDRRRDALQSLLHYERRFARGKHRESAVWLRVIILCAGDDRKACRAAAHTYLNRYPRGRHADSARQIINWDM